MSASRLPLGRYRVSVTTKAGDRPVDLGSLRVRYQPLFAFTEIPAAVGDPAADADSDDAGGESDDPADTPSPGADDPAVQDSGETTTLVPVVVDPPVAEPAHGGKAGFASFGNAFYNQPVPAGLSLADVTGITITDAQGVQRLSGSFLAPDRQTNHSLTIHFVAGVAAPLARGSVALSGSQGAPYQNNRFQLTAAGLPANAILTLTVNGKPVEQVTTGPNGGLFVTTADSESTKPSNNTDPINLLPDAVDLFSAESFGLSDARGNILATAGTFSSAR